MSTLFLSDDVKPQTYIFNSKALKAVATGPPANLNTFSAGLIQAVCAKNSLFARGFVQA